MLLFLVPAGRKASFVQALKGHWAQMHFIATYCRGREGATHPAVHLSFLLVFHFLETEFVPSYECGALC